MHWSNGKAAFEVGDWVVRPELDRLERNGIAVTLEPRVMDVLVCLARHDGDVVSPDELVDEVWHGSIVSDAPLYQCLAKLRKALGDDVQRPRYIETVRKRGYRLVAPVSVVAPTPVAVHVDAGRTASRYLAPMLSLLLGCAFLFLSSSDVSVSHERSIANLGPFDSIAVLPFVDMSEAGDQQYLGDGIAEELIYRIATAGSVRVVARTSSFSFRESETDVQEIGRRLGASVVLEGSVRRSGDRLRITTQLVNAADGYQIWSTSYEPALDDAFIVQDQIALSVVQILQGGAAGGASTARSWTLSAKAAKEYYLGIFQMHKRRPKPLAQAIRHLQQAVTYDPQFALAHVGLAWAYFLASDERFGNLPEEISVRNSKAALRTAEALDDDLPEVLDLLADEALERGEIAQAEQLHLRAIAIDSSRASAYKQYGMMLAMTDRLTEALAARQRAVELDPLSPILRASLAINYSQLNRQADAEAEFMTAIELDPHWHVPYFWLAHSVPEWQFARSIVLLKKAVTIEGPGARFAGMAAMQIGYIYLTLADYTAVERWYRRGADAGVQGWSNANFHLHLLLAQDRYDDADALLTHWARNEPELPGVFSLGGLYRAVLGQEAEAIAMYEFAQTLSSELDAGNLFRRDFLRWGYVPAVHLARLYDLENRPEEAKRLLRQSERFVAAVEQEAPGFAGAHYVRASMHAVQANKPAALESLRLAVDNGWSKLWFLERDPIFAAYRGDPGFEAIVDEISAHLASQRKDLLQLAQAGGK